MKAVVSSLQSVSHEFVNLRDGKKLFSVKKKIKVLFGHESSCQFIKSSILENFMIQIIDVPKLEFDRKLQLGVLA